MPTLSQDGTKLVVTEETEKDIPAMYKQKAHLQGLIDRYTAEMALVQADIDAAVAAGYVPE